MDQLRENEGLPGATLTLSFIFWNVDQNVLSGDSTIKFFGVCGPASFDETTLTVAAQNRMNMSQMMLPPMRMQKLRPWIFPATSTQRVDAALNKDSSVWEWGYSEDVNTSGVATGGANPTPTRERSRRIQARFARVNHLPVRGSAVDDPAIRRRPLDIELRLDDDSLFQVLPECRCEDFPTARQSESPAIAAPD